MAVLDYTTTITVKRTLAEVQQLLADAGAQSVSVEYDEHRQPSGLTFIIRSEHGALPYRLPVRVTNVLTLLKRASNERSANGKRKVPTTWLTPEHAARVAWRQIRHFLEAQLALVQVGLVPLDEIMLPYQLVDGDKTLYSLAVEKGLLRLPKPK